MKRLLFGALTVAMVLGLGSTAFGAPLPPVPHGDGVVQPAAFTDIAGHEAEGELTLLGAMGVFTGDAGLGGAVKPDDPITRAQFCKVLVSAMGRGSTAAGLAGLQPTFTDGATIPSWAWGSVNVAVYMGIINGYADGSFGPNNPVTYAEAVTMLIRAVPGHAAQVGAGIWPYNFLFYGVDSGFVGGVDVGFANLPCTRGDMARMVVATMQLDKLDKDGNALDDPPTAVLEPLTGTVTDFAAGTVEIDGDTYGLADKVWIGGAKDLAGLMGLPVVAVFDDDEFIYCLWVSGESNAVTGILADPFGDADDDGDADCIVLADGTKVPYEEDGDVSGTLNRVSDCCLHDLEADGGAEITITLGADGLAAGFVATEFDSVFTHDISGGDNFFFAVLDVIPSDETYDATDPGTWPMVIAPATMHGFAPVPATCRVTLNGEPAEATDLEVGDVIDVAIDHQNSVDGYFPPFEIRAHREIIEGTVAGASVIFPGPTFSVTVDLTSGETKTYDLVPFGGALPMPPKGWNVKYGLDFNGDVLSQILYETLTPYAVCTGYQVDGDGTLTATFDIRGEEKTYELDAAMPADGEGNPAWIGEYVYIEVDTGSGMVDVGDSGIVDPSGLYEVKAVDAENGTMTLWNPGGYEFVADDTTVIYEVNDAGDKVYVGFEGLSADDFVLWDGVDFVFQVTEPIF